MNRLTAAIAAFHTANAAIPHHAPDAEMDAAVAAAAAALDRVVRIPAFTLAEVHAKLELAVSLEGWSTLADRLTTLLEIELAAIKANDRLRAA